IDMSGIIDQAKKIVKANGFEDSSSLPCSIVLIKGKLEDVQLPVDKVDIIISEWMGYFLLYESMLDTVLLARDRYLVQTWWFDVSRLGNIVHGWPRGSGLQGRKNQLYAFASLPSLLAIWDDVYGFDYSCIKEIALREPLVDTVELRAVTTNPCAVRTFDLLTVTKADLAFTAPFSLEATLT
ncbi:protein arginine N-methyltransferase, partial [Puccinia sorghi]